MTSFVESDRGRLEQKDWVLTSSNSASSAGSTMTVRRAFPLGPSDD